MAIKFLSTVAVDTNVLYVNAAANKVGIGTTSPQEKLDISAGNIRLDDNQKISWSSSDSNIGRVRITGNESNDFITIATDNSERVRINNTGVGIGVTVPRAKLDVAGGVKVADDTDSASANKVGTLRYRYVPGSPKNFSYVDMCMQTGASSYAWVNIVQNVWN